jgi:TetR/AcrR family transcriptional regulator, regulator of cefoperazone and chloramphenicol sensitivity
MSDKRERILESACEIFAAKGFRNATVADICGKAGANVASVNYYFGSKESLYGEAVKQAFQVANEQFALDGGLPADAPAEERLGAFIAAKVRRVFCDDVGGHAQKMVAHEFSNPISSVSRLFKKELAPQRDILHRAIRDLASGKIPERTLRICGFNVVSLCDSRSFDLRARTRFLEKRVFSDEDIDRLAEDVTRFALGGIRAALSEEANGSADTDPEMQTSGAV